MILNGNQRGYAGELANHLLKEENDHIVVHELRGFIADDLHGAFQEAEAISKATRCKQHLFSLSLNPPEKERVSTAAFERAVDKVEAKLGLINQPRAIVFHEKNGRRHAHAVWSRIDTAEMKAIQLSHSHRKLRTVSRELFFEHGWELPQGLINRESRDPKNFSLEEWQQAQRRGKDPRAIKTDLQEAWATSDSKAALSHALDERGYVLARGDRRGYVVLDRQGEIYALPKWLGIKTKEVRAKLGPAEKLPDLTQARATVAQLMTPAMMRLEAERKAKAKTEKQAFEAQRRNLVKAQREERKRLEDFLKTRWLNETRARQARFQTGLSSLWDILTGKAKRTREVNEREAYAALKRDQTIKDALIATHLDQRRVLNKDRDKTNTRQAQTKAALTTQQNQYDDMRREAFAQRKAQMRALLKSQAKDRDKSRTRTRDGPDLSL